MPQPVEISCDNHNRCSHLAVMQPDRAGVGAFGVAKGLLPQNGPVPGRCTRRIQTPLKFGTWGSGSTNHG